MDNWRLWFLFWGFALVALCSLRLWGENDGKSGKRGECVFSKRLQNGMDRRLQSGKCCSMLGRHSAVRIFRSTPTSGSDKLTQRHPQFIISHRILFFFCFWVSSWVYLVIRFSTGQARKLGGWVARGMGHRRRVSHLASRQRRDNFSVIAIAVDFSFPYFFFVHFFFWLVIKYEWRR